MSAARRAKPAAPVKGGLRVAPTHELSAMAAGRLLVGIVVGALALRLGALLVFPAPELTSDAAVYEGLAWRVAQGLGYTTPAGAPTAFFPPLYSYAVGALYGVFGRDPNVVRVTQAVLSALVCVAVYDVAHTLTGRRGLAVAAAALTALDVSLVLYPRLLLSEGLFLPLVAVAMVAWARAWRRDHLRWWTVFGVSIGLATLTRPPIQFLPVVALALWPWRPDPAPRATRRRWLTVAVVVFAAYAITIAPWVWRNTELRGHFTPALTSSTGTGLFISFYPLDGWRFGLVDAQDPVWVEGQRIKEEGTLDAEYRRSDYLAREVKARLHADPARPLLLVPLKLAYIAWPYDWSLFNGAGRLDVTYVYLFPFVMVGVVALVRDRRLVATAPVWLIVVYTVVMSVVFLGAPRYRMPVQPYLDVVAASGVLAFVAWRPRWRTWLAGWTAAVVVFILIEHGVRELLVSIFRRSGGA